MRTLPSRSTRARSPARCTPARTQVGAHFSRFGRVLDVVLVKDFGTLLRLAGQATALERQREAAGQMLGRHAARKPRAKRPRPCCTRQPGFRHPPAAAFAPQTASHAPPPAAGAYQKRVAKAEQRLGEFMRGAEEVIDRAGWWSARARARCV